VKLRLNAEAEEEKIELKGAGRRREGDCRRGTTTEKEERKKTEKRAEGKLFE
jgi:hypothetical protein